MAYFKVGNTGLELAANFKSHKTVAAVKIQTIQHDTFDDQPVTRLIFDNVPSIDIADSELANKPVPQAGMYLVAYKDNYFSFSPAKEFEEGYTLEPNLTEAADKPTVQGIGWAVKQLHNGSKVARAGWNGKGQWVVLIHSGNAMYTKGGSGYPMQPCLGLKNTQGNMQPGWVPSQGDLLATDWEIAD